MCVGINVCSWQTTYICQKNQQGRFVLIQCHSKMPMENVECIQVKTKTKEKTELKSNESG